MNQFRLKIQQLVDYPRCRIYRQFVQSLIHDRSIRASGGSGLFYYTVLYSYANFRTSYQRIDGISYTVYPGEWLCSIKELSQRFRTRFQWQALSILEYLSAKQKRLPEKWEGARCVMILFWCFISKLFTEENAQVIPATAKNTIHIHIASMHAIENQVAPGDQEAVVCVRIRNGG